MKKNKAQGYAHYEFNSDALYCHNYKGNTVGFVLVTSKIPSLNIQRIRKITGPIFGEMLHLAGPISYDYRNRISQNQ